MASFIRRWLPAFLIGLAVTFMFVEMDLSGAVSPNTANVLLWPATVLVSLVPSVNIGTAEEPFYEGTPIHLLAWLAGILLCVPYYALAADALIRLLKKLLRP